MKAIARNLVLVGFVSLQFLGLCAKVPADISLRNQAVALLEQWVALQQPATKEVETRSMRSAPAFALPAPDVNKAVPVVPGDVVELKTLEEVQRAVAQPGMTVITVTRDNCPYCKKFAPLYEETSKACAAVEGLKFYTVKDNNSKLSLRAFEGAVGTGYIAKAPTILFFNGGVLQYRHTGAPLAHGKFARIVEREFTK